MRIEQERYLELLKQGNEIRQRYIEEAKIKVDETKKSLEEYKAQLQSAEELKIDKENVKKQVEELEKEALDKHREEEQKLQKSREEELQKVQDAEAVQRVADVFKQLDSNGDGILTLDEIKTNLMFDRDNDEVVTDDEAKFYLAGASEVNSDVFSEKVWTLIQPLLEVFCSFSTFPLLKRCFQFRTITLKSINRLLKVKLMLMKLLKTMMRSFLKM